ncbi:aminotransferase class V-fold PLP-dependent enzyme [Candidatus Sumerlaeota bacterium]|nr:aminotransferase class V-fold PLP-dependent enzyme [Candidatus Sumerlaeota bacterium]
MRTPTSDIRGLFVGVEQQVPLLDGTTHVYVNFDNAATTPPFRAVVDAVEQMFPYYAGVHRGTGFKSMLSTYLYEQARLKVAEFVGADPSKYVVIFTRNTTDSINKLCHHLPLKPDELVLTTVMEHHSNLLPWWIRGQVDYVLATTKYGAPEIEALKKKLEEHKGKVKLVALCGASNVTGYIPPIRQVARLAHQYGAMLLVDAAQLVAHRKITMQSPDEEEAIDFLAFSAHKMYAPFGTGVLVGPKEFFRQKPPDVVGGGTVELVTLNQVEWTEPPEKEEAGTPNLPGVVALSRSIEILSEIGFDYIQEHERHLTSYMLKRLAEIPEVIIHSDPNPQMSENRVGVIPINVKGIEHSLLAAILGFEWGIGVRHGCFCAHPYIMHLFNIHPDEVQPYLEQIRRGDHRGLPGFVRISFALYNTTEEIDYFISALKQIIRQGPRAKYVVQTRTGEYFPEGFDYDYSTYISSILSSHHSG